MLKYTTKEFIEKLIINDKKNNINYDYSKFEYKGTFIKSTIICKKHGEFQMKPNNRLNGQECYYCGKIKNIKPVLIRQKDFFKKMTNTKYLFKKFIFVNAHTPGIVTCTLHGDFNMAPKHLARGHGCKECGHLFSGYRKSDWVKKSKQKKGIFYLLKCTGNNEIFYKVGITSISVKERYRKKNYMPYDYSILKEIVSDDLNFIWELENKVKKENRTNRYNPLIKFPGSKYECFLYEPKI